MNNKLGPEEYRCKRCAVIVLGDYIEESLCGDCADIVYEQYLERRDFQHWHP
jgi:hypothetical protein